MFSWLRELWSADCSNLKRYTSEDLKKMSKRQLEEHARKYGVELDRRENKEKLIKETVRAQIKGIKKK